MNKKKSAILILLIVTLFTLATCLLVACNSDPVETPTNEEIEATEGLLINNSDFKVVDTAVSTYPRTSTGWSGAKMYSSSLFRDDVVAGVISLAKGEYDDNRKSWSDDNGDIYKLLNQDGRYDGDKDAIKHALMVYMPQQTKNDDGDNIHGPTAYGYTSSSFTLNKGSYYKLTVDVLTHNIAGDGKSTQAPGARIYVSSNTYAEFDRIDTQDKWETFEIYIETSPSSSTSLSVQLGLGKYTSSDTTGLTTGYAFFDNVELTCLDNEETEDVIEGAEDFNRAQEAELADAKIDGKHVQTTSLKVPNGRFEFGSLSPSSSGTPNSWSLVTGNSSKDDPAPSNSANWNAVIDTAKFAENCENYSTTLTMRSGDNVSSNSYKPAENLKGIADSILRKDTVGTKVYMLSQQYMTAQSIRSSRTITIEKGKTYALSVWLYTFDIHGDGVSLILTSSDSEDIVIKGISRNKSSDIYIGSRTIEAGTGYSRGETYDPGATTDEWKEFVFYIKGNQYSNYNYNVNIWLGTEGTNSNNAVRYHNFTSGATAATTYDANGTFSNGWVFVDDLALKEIADTEFDEVFTENTFEVDYAEENKSFIAVDLSDDENSLADILTAGEDEIDLDNVTKIGSGAPVGWTSNVDTSDNKVMPLTNGNIYQGIVDITDDKAFQNSLSSAIDGSKLAYPDIPYDMSSKKAYMIYADSTGYFEVESGAINIAANSFYRITFWLKTSDIKSSSGAYVYLLDKTAQAEDKQHKEVNLTSFTKINTADYDTYQKDWVEINIVIRGGDEPKDVALKFTLGTGNRFDASTRTSGEMYVANFRMASITYANFNGTSTSTYTKSVDMHKAPATSSTFANSSFNSYDPDDENLEPGVPLTEQTNAAAPENWTINDNTLELNQADKDGFAGIIALTDNKDGTFSSSAQATSVTGLSESNFENFYPTDFSDVENMKAVAGPNMLALGTRTKGERLAMGFASESFTLSANTYYSLTVYARTENGAQANIFLTGESSSVGENSFSVSTETEGAWTKFTFFIQVGKTSVSLKLNLWFGNDWQYQPNTDHLDEDAFKDSFKSEGMVFFDNIVFKTIEEDDYNEATVDNFSKKISFMTDSFDALSSTVESRGSLTSPTGWSGAAGTNQSSSNTKSGIIYADPDYYENKAVTVGEGEDAVTETYVGILGNDYDSESIQITDQELAEARASGKYTDKSEADLLDILESDKRTELKTKNWIPISELQTRDPLDTSNKQMLVINNTSASAYTYTSSTNTFSQQSYYKVSVWVRTYGIGAGEPEDEVEDMDEYIKSKKAGAYIELYLGSANETDNPMIFEAIVSDEWQQYTFYVQTQEEDVTSVTVKLSLGKYFSEEVNGQTEVSGLTNGYAMFDDVEIIKLDDFDDDFETIFAKTNSDDEAYDEEFAKTTLARTVKDEVSGTPDEDEDDTTVPQGNTFNLEYLWWMIPTIVLGVMIIVVVVVFIIRKVRKPAKKQVTKVKANKTSAPAATQTLDVKRDKYDEDKD